MGMAQSTLGLGGRSEASRIGYFEAGVGGNATTRERPGLETSGLASR